jgi:4-amino-4-deoxy-L-arabinose transferase-like glycosyltransferase
MTVLSRLPFLAPRLAHWDAVNYALGLHRFDVAAHQPHPPGSPYFVLLGRAALLVTGDDNAALILVSVLASVGAVIGEYALARMLSGRRAALLSALVLMTQPVFWGYGTIATAWTLLACLSVGIGLLCAAMLRGARRVVIPSAVALGVASGFRLDVTAFLAPLWLFAVWQVEPKVSRRLLACVLVAAGVALWLVPVAAGTSGGVNGWWGRLLALLPDRSQGVLARQFTGNTLISFGTLFVVVGPSLVLATMCDRRAAARWLRSLSHSALGVFWVLWIAPAFVFLWLVDSTEPGHDLVFVPALCVLGSAAVVQAAPRLRRLLVCGAALVAVQAIVFLYAAPVSNAPLAQAMNLTVLNLTARGIRAQQASLESALGAIRTQFDPADTVVLTLTDQDPYRFMMYYLPEYPVLRLDPRAHIVLAARDRQQGHWQQASGCAFESARLNSVVWVLASASDPRLVPATATRVSGTDGGEFEVWAERLGNDTLEYQGFAFDRDCEPRAASA